MFHFSVNMNILQLFLLDCDRIQTVLVWMLNLLCYCSKSKISVIWFPSSWIIVEISCCNIISCLWIFNLVIFLQLMFDKMYFVIGFTSPLIAPLSSISQPFINNICTIWWWLLSGCGCRLYRTGRQKNHGFQRAELMRCFFTFNVLPLHDLFL